MAMGTWRKTPEAVADAFHAALPDDPRVERRKMFGYPGAFVGGNMFSGTFADSIVVRLPEEQRAEVMKQGAARFEPMSGRPMKEYVVVPEPVASDATALRSWVRRAFDAALSLPPKEAKPRKPKSR